MVAWRLARGSQGFRVSTIRTCAPGVGLLEDGALEAHDVPLPAEGAAKGLPLQPAEARPALVLLISSSVCLSKKPRVTFSTRPF